MSTPLPAELLRKMDAFWRAANYLSVGQIYLFDNPLLKKPLDMKHIKPKEAYEFLHEHPEAVLIDCRSEIEYLFVGHPVPMAGR